MLNECINDVLTVVANKVGSVGGAWIGAGAGTPGGRDTLWDMAGCDGTYTGAEAYWQELEQPSKQHNPYPNPSGEGQSVSCCPTDQQVFLARLLLHS